MFKKVILSHGKLLQRALILGQRNLSLTKVCKALPKDHYEILGIKRDATQADIKNAYFELTKIYHPDRIEATDENLAKFREILNAYEVLGNEQSRKLYDRGLISDQATETEDIKDPIVQFYKKRHEKGKITSEDQQGEDMDEWTKQFSEKARREVFTKNELFQQKTYEKQGTVQAQDRSYYVMAVALLLNVIFFANFEDHNVSKWLRSLRSMLNF